MKFDSGICGIFRQLYFDLWNWVSGCEDSIVGIGYIPSPHDLEFMLRFPCLKIHYSLLILI